MEQTFDVKPKIKDRKNKNHLQIRGNFWDTKRELKINGKFEL